MTVLPGVDAAQLIESVPDAIVIADKKGNIVLVNSQFEKLFKISAVKVLGKPVETVLPRRFRKAHKAHRGDFVKHPNTRPMGLGLQLYALTADGQEFPVEVSLSPLKVKHGDDLVIAAIRDVTQQRQSEALFRGFLEAAPDAILVVDQKGSIQLVNSQTEELLGYSRDELLGESLERLVPQSARRAHIDMRQRYHRNPYIRPMASGLDLYAVHKDGRDIPVEIGLSPLDTAEGPLIVCAIRDVSTQKSLNERLTVLSITDQLTGLLNRRGFHEVGGKLRALAKRSDAHLVLMMVDVDRLKEINDQYGHSTGDQYLQDIATVLQQSVRESDVIARWGGDEFMVLVLEVEQSHPDKLVKRIKANLKRFAKNQGREYPLSLSVGWATGDPGKDDFEKLIEAADQSMYTEKGRGQTHPD